MEIKSGGRNSSFRISNPFILLPLVLGVFLSSSWLFPGAAQATFKCYCHYDCTHTGLPAAGWTAIRTIQQIPTHNQHVNNGTDYPFGLGGAEGNFCSQGEFNAMNGKCHENIPAALDPDGDRRPNGTFGENNAQCDPPDCGNGHVEGDEECDDGNDIDDDDCDNECRRNSCGDGELDRGEECDDGNRADMDGCSSKCRLEKCGDGVVQPMRGEQCDPGCPPGDQVCQPDPDCTEDCHTRKCGDGKIDPGEVCDDGNNEDGDLCSKDCSHIATCGDGQVQEENGEACDPGVQCGRDSYDCIPGELCTPWCKLAKCGDGIINVSVVFDPSTGKRVKRLEECDDADKDDTDGCGNDCRINFCGDGELQSGDPLNEDCDDGNNEMNDGCSPHCWREFCGDGVVNAFRFGKHVIKEECDPPLPGKGCNHFCQVEFCGDGHVQPKLGEQCDPGHMCRWWDYHCKPDDKCTEDCHSFECGDGIVQDERGEDCDDANTDNGDGCNAECQGESCGDGIIQYELGEECDKGEDNGKAGVRCSDLCQIRECGDGITDGDLGEDCDDGDDPWIKDADGDGCDRHCNHEYCGDGNVQGGPPANEECDDGNNKSGDGCSAHCWREFCGDGVVNAFRLRKYGHLVEETCDDGEYPPKSGDGCDQYCQREFCGDGHVQPQLGEQCDPGPKDCAWFYYDHCPKDENCSDDCHTLFCGDGIVQSEIHETCDDGMACRDGHPCGDDHDCYGHGGHCRPRGGDGCNRHCQSENCGDGHVQTGGVFKEECDDGNQDDADGCDSLCQIEYCGDGMTQPDIGIRDKSGEPKSEGGEGNNEHCDDGNENNSDGCNNWCQYEYCGDGIVQDIPPLQEECDNGRACSDGYDCDDHDDCYKHLGEGERCLPRSDDGCSAHCWLEFCGDGIVNTDKETGKHDECDDGNHANGDGCTSDCRREYCGDGTRQPQLGEQCDPGTVCKEEGYEGDYCHADEECTEDCHSFKCGDGIVQSARGETCDDGNNTSGDGCSAECHSEKCGDGIPDQYHAFFEECDDGNHDDGDGCSSLCQDEVCGDGIPQPTLGEQCDDGASISGDGCNDTCQFEYCGDNVVQSDVPLLEDCDGSVCCNNKLCDFEPAGTPCDDGNENTINDDCDGAGTCAGEERPEDSGQAAGGGFEIRGGSDATGGGGPCSLALRGAVPANPSYLAWLLFSLAGLIAARSRRR